jgi:uncharacterized protein (TIGR00369 family)
VANFNTELGLKHEGEAVVLEATAAHQVAPDVIHFAVLTTMCEVAAAKAVGVTVMPAQISVNLLSPAKPGRLVARGKLVRLGKRLAVAEGEVTQGEKLVAKAVVTFAVM